MADELKLSQPTAPSSSSTNAQIFTMPEQYRHGKEVKLVEPIKEKIAVPPPPKPVPLQPKPTPKHTQKALIISGAAVLVALLIGGYLLFRSTQKQTPEPQPQTQPVVEQPAPRPEVETPVVEEESEEIPTETESPFAQEIVPGKDSDSDGLTDVEETSIYKTEPGLPDTDSDGFLDGNEVFHRYNPSGTAPGTLLEAGLVKTFVSAEGVGFLLPALWTSETLALPDPTVSLQPVQSLTRFTAITQELIDVGIYAVQTTEQSQTLLVAWIDGQGGQEQVIKTRTKNGNELYISRDQLDAFLMLKDRPIVFTYVLGTKGTIEYLQTFQMMLNSVQ